MSPSPNSEAEAFCSPQQFGSSASSSSQLLPLEGSLSNQNDPLQSRLDLLHRGLCASIFLGRQTEIEHSSTSTGTQSGRPDMPRSAVVLPNENSAREPK
jgi:hypothetical protein